MVIIGEKSQTTERNGVKKEAGPVAGGTKVCYDEEFWRRFAALSVAGRSRNISVTTET